MLEPVPGLARLQGAEAQHGTGIDVFVQSIDVGERVVQHVVLDLPHFTVATDHFQHTSQEAVDPFLFAVRSVVAIVHDRHSNTGQCQTHDDFSCPKHPTSAGYASGDQHKRAEVAGQQDHSFDHHCQVGLFVDAIFFEMRIYPLAQCFRETGGVPAKPDGGQIYGRCRHEWPKIQRLSSVVPLSAWTVHLRVWMGNLVGNFAHPQSAWRDLHVFAVCHPFEVFLKRHLFGRCNAQSLVAARSPHVGELFASD